MPLPNSGIILPYWNSTFKQGAGAVIPFALHLGKRNYQPKLNERIEQCLTQLETNTMRCSQLITSFIVNPLAAPRPSAELNKRRAN